MDALTEWRRTSPEFHINRGVGFSCPQHGVTYFPYAHPGDKIQCPFCPKRRAKLHDEGAGL